MSHAVFRAGSKARTNQTQGDDTPRLPYMGLDSNALLKADQNAPHVGQGEHAEQPLKVVMKRHMGVLKLKSLGFQYSKQALNFPPLPIGFQNFVRFHGVTRHEQDFPICCVRPYHVHWRTEDLNVIKQNP